MVLCTPLRTHVQDHTIVVWDVISPMDIILRNVLKGHTGGVYAVDFDEKYIVSGSADFTIKVRMCGRKWEKGEGRGSRGTRGRGACVKSELLISYPDELHIP